MKPDNIYIRKAEVGDIPVIQAIYNEAILQTTALMEYYPYSDQYMADWFKNKQDEGFPIFVACEQNAVLGFSSYGHFRQRPGFKYTVESTVYVGKQSRGKGIGQSLVEMLITHAKRKSIHSIIACIESSNHASIKLHEQFTFKKAAEFKEVGYKFGRWIDLFFYELILPESSNNIS